MAGWSLYLDDGGHPVYLYNFLGRDLTPVAGTEPLTPGTHILQVDFNYDGGGLGKGGTATVSVDSRAMAAGRIEATVPFLFSMSGETLDVGLDTGSPVGPYPTPNRFTGTINRVEIELLSDLNAELAAAFGEGQARGALAQQ